VHPGAQALWFRWETKVSRRRHVEGERGATRPAQAPRVPVLVLDGPLKLSRRFNLRVSSGLALRASHIDNLAAKRTKHLLDYRIFFRLFAQALLLAALSFFL
jgi:hypothetical protein